MSGTDTKLCYLKLKTNRLTDEMAQLTLNNQKENGHSHRHSWAWVLPTEEDGACPNDRAEAPAPLAESNNPPGAP